MANGALSFGGFATESYADQAEADAKTYADGLVVGLASEAYADQAEADAKTYADGLVVGLAAESAVEGLANTEDVNQVAHGFSAGDWVYISGTGAYAKAQANDADTADVEGVVDAVADVDNFTLRRRGLSSAAAGMTPGAAQFLSASTAGAQTETKTTTSTEVQAPLAVAKSATVMDVKIQRPSVNP